MKNLMVLVLITFVFIADGCKKKDQSKDEIPVPEKTLYLQKSSRDSSASFVSVNEYTYDKNGRLIQTKQNTGESTIYNWSGNQMVQKFFSASNSQIGIITYILNSSGQVISGSGSFSTDNISLSYVYDANGFLSRQTTKSGSGTSTTVYTITDGNVSKSVDSGIGAAATTLFDYYTDKPNTIGYASLGTNIAGRESKNLLKTESFSDGSSSHYDYAFDSKNRVAKKMRSDSDGKINLVTAYTYYE